MASERENQGTGPAIDPAREFLEFWRNYFEQTAIQTRIRFETMQGGKSLEQLHGQWLAALSEGLDSFMRTPPFLEVLKQSLTRMTEMKRLQDQMSQSMAQQAGLPLAADVAGVVERVESAERAILKRLDRLEERMGAIEAALQPGPTEKEKQKRTPARRKELAARKKDERDASG
jgi:hypothetical protein